MAVLALVGSPVLVASPPVRADDRTGETPSATGRVCSNWYGPSDRDTLSFLLFVAPSYLFVFKSLSSPSSALQLFYCSSSTFGGTWDGSGGGGGSYRYLNQTIAMPSPGDFKLHIYEVWDPFGDERLNGPWGSPPIGPSWPRNATNPSVVYSPRVPQFGAVAFNTEESGGSVIAFTRASRDALGNFPDWTTPFVVAGLSGPTGPVPSTMPSIALDASDRVHLAYLRSDTTGRRDVYYLRNDARGDDGAWTWEPGVRLSSGSADNHDLVIAASHKGETVAVIWTATRPGGDEDLMYSYSLDGGTTWPVARTLSATPSREGYPAIGVDPVTSNLHVAYWRDDSNATRHNNVLYAEASWGDPGNWTTARSVVDAWASVSDTDRRPGIASYWPTGSNNSVSIAWTDTRNPAGWEDIYMTSMDVTPLQCAVMAAPTTGAVPLSVAFNSTVAGGAPPYAYMWRFGDGATTAGPNVTAHTYGMPGTYNAVLEVTDAVGNVCFDAVPIQVLSPLPDLAVRSIDVVPSPSPHVEGTPSWVNGTVRNLGGGSGTDVPVRLALGGRGGPSLGDQRVPSIPSLTNRSVSFPWTPSSAGATTVCVVADPDDTIVEVDEGNNAGCIATNVLPRPDLAFLPGDVSANPGGAPVGSAVNLTATLRNLGGSEARAVPVTFFLDEDGNRLPGISEAFDTQNVATLAAGATTPLASAWTADRVGPLTLCVYADANGTIPEGNETNNGACAGVTVLGPPDYAPWNPQPSSPFVSGLSQPLEFSVEVRNAGGTAANRTATLAFFNESTPGTPFATFFVPPLDAGDRSSLFVGTWRSPAIPGTYAIVADVDHEDDLAEWDEGNNAYTWTVDVVAGPVTDLVVGTPSTTSTAVYVTSATDFSFSVLDQSGTGIRRTMYRVDNGSWEDHAATGPFRLTGEGERFLEWSSEDYAGNVEATQSATVRVDDTPPTTTLAIGDPKYLVGGTYVTSATPLTLTASDGGVTPVGVALSEYRIDGGPWTPYTSSFSLAGDGLHGVAYRSLDALGNLESDQSATVLVDDTPPATTLAVGEPKHMSAQTFVTSSTPVSLSAVDGGVNPVGIAFIECRVDTGSWIPHAAPFVLAGEGTHLVEYRSGDLLGNVETTLAATFVVDDTSPSLELDLGTPRYDGTETYVTSATPLSIAATDGGPVPVGVASLEYRLTGSWTPYAGAFVLDGPDGARAVQARATDLLGNAFGRDLELVLDNTPPTTTPSRGDGAYPAGTTFGFTATDGGSGVSRTEVLVDRGAWMAYAAPLTFAPGVHTIGFRSVDNLNNTEAELALSVTIEGAPLPVPEPNWKPPVAAAFSAILVLVGIQSARRVPANVGSRPRVRAFVLAALPFIVIEASTGIVSLLTGWLSIPPILGLGTAVDVAILVAGVAILARRVRKRTPPT